MMESNSAIGQGVQKAINENLGHLPARRAS
jgi:hypothetical protein